MLIGLGWLCLGSAGWCRIHPRKILFSELLFTAAVSKPLWHITLLCVQWKTSDDGQKNCPKHVEFYIENKLQKLVHLVGFIIRNYHDARAPERQICLSWYPVQQILYLKELELCSMARSRRYGYIHSTLLKAGLLLSGLEKIKFCKNIILCHGDRKNQSVVTNH